MTTGAAISSFASGIMAQAPRIARTAASPCKRIAAGPVVSGVAGVTARRRVLARVGDGAGLWFEVAA